MKWGEDDGIWDWDEYGGGRCGEREGNADPCVLRLLVHKRWERDAQADQVPGRPGTDPYSLRDTGFVSGAETVLRTSVRGVCMQDSGRRQAEGCKADVLASGAEMVHGNQYPARDSGM